MMFPYAQFYSTGGMMPYRPPENSEGEPSAFDTLNGNKDEPEKRDIPDDTPYTVVYQDTEYPFYLKKADEDEIYVKAVDRTLLAITIQGYSDPPMEFKNAVMLFHQDDRGTDWAWVNKWKRLPLIVLSHPTIGGKAGNLLMGYGSLCMLGTE